MICFQRFPEFLFGSEDVLFVCLGSGICGSLIVTFIFCWFSMESIIFYLRNYWFEGMKVLLSYSCMPIWWHFCYERNGKIFGRKSERCLSSVPKKNIFWLVCHLSWNFISYSILHWIPISIRCLSSLAVFCTLLLESHHKISFGSDSWSRDHNPPNESS